MTRYANSRHSASNCPTGIVFLLIVTMFFVGVLTANYLEILRFSKTGQEIQISNLAAMERRLARVEIQYQAEFEKKVEWVISYAAQFNSSISIDVARTIVSQSYLYKNLNIELICAVITHESATTWDEKIVSHMGAIGLMQIMPATGIYLYDLLKEDLSITWTSAEDVLTNPIYNIRMGCFYLSMLIDRHGLYVGLACYNGPHAKARQFGVLLATGATMEEAFSTLAPETIHFLSSILRRYNKLLKITGGTA